MTLTVSGFFPRVVIEIDQTGPDNHSRAVADSAWTCGARIDARGSRVREEGCYAANAGAVGGIRASRTARAGYLVPLGANGKFPASVGQAGPAGPARPAGTQGPAGPAGPSGAEAWALVDPNGGSPRLVTTHGFSAVGVGPFGPGDLLPYTEPRRKRRYDSGCRVGGGVLHIRLRYRHCALPNDWPLLSGRVTGGEDVRRQPHPGTSRRLSSLGVSRRQHWGPCLWIAAPLGESTYQIP